MSDIVSYPLIGGADRLAGLGGVLPSWLQGPEVVRQLSDDISASGFYSGYVTRWNPNQSGGLGAFDDFYNASIRPLGNPGLSGQLYIGLPIGYTLEGNALYSIAEQGFGSDEGSVLCVSPIFQDWTSGSLRYIGTSGTPIDLPYDISTQSGYVLTVGGSLHWRLPTGGATLGSGSIQSGMIASGAVISGTIASGTISTIDIASGIISPSHFIPQSVRSGTLYADAVTNQRPVFGGSVSPIYPNSLTALEMASGAIVSGNIASGQVGLNHLASGVRFFLSSGAVISGYIASGQVGLNHLASGVRFFLSSGAVISGYIASGQVGHAHLADNSVQSGNLASGNITTYHIASGAWITANTGSSGLLSGKTYFAMSGADGTWVTSDGTLSLPSVRIPDNGLYQLNYTARCAIQPTAVAGNNNALSLRLNNSITGNLVSGSKGIALLNATANRIDVGANNTSTAYIASGDIIQLQSKRSAVSGVNIYITADDGGEVAVSYMRIN